MFSQDNLSILFYHYTFYVDQCEKEGKSSKNFIKYVLDLLKA